MDNSFKTFLQSSAKPEVQEVAVQKKVVVESKQTGFGPTDRVGLLKEKTEMFCKKFGDFGMDSLDTFFKESVERLLNLKTESIVTKTPQTPTKPMNAIEHAMALMEDANPRPASTTSQNPAGNDIMSKASMLM